jgi:hypothetical protein
LKVTFEVFMAAVAAGFDPTGPRWAMVEEPGKKLDTEFVS